MGLDNKNIRGADDIIAKLNAAKQYLITKAPIVVGQEAVNHFKRNFQLEGFVDKSIDKWDTRKTKRLGSTDNQKTLTKSGDLGDSIDFKIEGNVITIYSDKVYAKIHNEGGIIAVTDKMKKYFWAMHYQATEQSDIIAANQYKFMALSKIIVLPKRKYMGPSEQLNENIIEKLKRDLNAILL